MAEGDTNADQALSGSEKSVSLSSLPELKKWLDNAEQTWGAIKSLKVIGTKTIAAFEAPCPAKRSLKIVPSIEDKAPPTPKDHELVIVGKALILAARQGVAVFRKIKA